MGRLSALVVMTLVAASPVAAAVSPKADGLVVTDPLPGYERIEGGELDGAIDAETLMELAGTDPSDLPSEVRGLSGEARTWGNADGAVAVVFVIDCGDLNSVSDFLSGALDGSKGSSDSTFEPGVGGTAGFVVEQSTGTIRSVIWRQHTLFVEVFVVGVRGDSSEADAKTLAANQAAFLRSTTGATPTLNISMASPDAGLGYLLGRLFGIIVVIGMIAYMIWSIHRRKAARRALEARFAVPPRPFVPAPHSHPGPPSVE